MVIPSEEHLYQFVEALEGGSYGGYVEATVDSWETKFSTFNPTADWLKAPFVDVITETYPAYRGIINKTDDEVAVALANVLRVAIMNRLADAYGSIPYSKIVEDKKERLTVPYDTQQEAYTQMFKELDAALEALERNRDLSTEAFGEYDQVYNGDLKKWIKYANSLKLRMAMRLSLYRRADRKGQSRGSHRRRGHHRECRQCEASARTQPHGIALEQLAGSRHRSRHPLLHERLQRPAPGKDVHTGNRRRGRCRRERLLRPAHRHDTGQQVQGRNGMLLDAHYRHRPYLMDERSGNRVPALRI